MKTPFFKKTFFLYFIFILGTIFSFPPFNLGFIQWLVYIPLLFALKKSSWLNSLAAIFLGYLIINFTLLLWLKEQSWEVYLFVALLFACAKALQLTLLKFFLRREYFLLIPIFLTLFDYLSSLGQYGFPFLVAGYTQYNYYLLLQLASVGGVWLISFSIYLINLLGFLYLQKKDIKYIKYIIGLFMLIVSANFCFKEKEIATLRIGLVQPNINMFISQWADHQEKYFEEYLNLSLALKKEQPDLIIWPETAIGLSLRKNRSAAKKLRTIINKLETDLLIGNVDERMFNLRFKEKYNSAFYINKEGLVLGEHYKTKLIPFIELIHYQLLLPLNIRDKMNSGLFLKGSEKKPMRLNNYQATTIICFEAVFGNIVRSISKQKTNIIYNLSSDGWTSSLAAHQMNFAVNVLRAVENRLYLVRVSDNGISTIISPRGKILAIIPAFKKGGLVYPVPLLSNYSFYAKYGDLFILVLIILIPLYLFQISVNSNKKKKH